QVVGNLFLVPGGIGVNSNQNQIGGPAPADRNIISELALGGERNVVENNYISTNPAGTAGTGGGVVLFGSFNSVGPSNVISGGFGVHVSGDGPTTGNVIFGNFIGTDATGTLPLPNSIGVKFLGPANGNFVGTPPGPPRLSALYPGNRIAFN